MTSCEEARTKIPEFEGETRCPYILNVENHGYGKFIYDSVCIQAFEKNFGKIEDRETRKMVILQLFDMVRSNHMPGA
jgi:hypothetical protein